MIKHKLAAAAATALLGAALAAVPGSAAAAAKPWHIYNALASHGSVYIYADVGCAGSIHQLYPGQDAQSTGWDSFRVYSRPFNVLVFDGSDGRLLADRTYPAWTCVKAWKTNDYRVQVLL